jgi:sec-independent protein translocase protein TatA
MGDLLQPWHLIVLAVLAFLLFGARRLTELGKGLGEGLKGFKEGLKGITDPTPAAPTVQPTVQQTVAPAPPLVSTPATPPAAEMDYVVCSRCGNRFENPLGFKVTEYVCHACQSRG